MRDFLELWCYRERKFGRSGEGNGIRELIGCSRKGSSASHPPDLEKEREKGGGQKRT